MVERGWEHAALNIMYEHEFCFWLAQQEELDRLKAEAIKETTRGVK